METRRLEVAEIFRQHGERFVEQYPTSIDQRRVLADLTRCRTAELGGHKLRCADCEHEEYSYNSCRNRHCPKCQASARARWLKERETELLPVPYFHVVFTVPEAAAALALQNPRMIYQALFQAASRTLLEVAANPKRLGARIGFLAVLHTWGQNLCHHPHLHCVVPGGGLSLDGERWISGRPDYFLPIAILSTVFRGKFVSQLQLLRERQRISFHGRLASLAEETGWAEFIKTLYRSNWVVYAKPPFGGPHQVLRYLARYTHRVAISNSRLISMDESTVTFRWKDYARGNRVLDMTLGVLEFMRRFLLHVLPSGFVRIRSYGFLANRGRSKRVETVRALISQDTSTSTLAADEQRCQGNVAEQAEDDEQGRKRSCPKCSSPHFGIVETLQPRAPTVRPYFDSS